MELSWAQLELVSGDCWCGPDPGIEGGPEFVERGRTFDLIARDLKKI
jgi:hypothetical protein